MAPCKSTAAEVSFEWSHHRISSTDSKVRSALHISIIDSRSEKGDLKHVYCFCHNHRVLECKRLAKYVFTSRYPELVLSWYIEAVHIVKLCF